MLFKEIVDARTDARTDGRRTPDIEGSQKLTEHFVLRWAKNGGTLLAGVTTPNLGTVDRLCVVPCSANMDPCRGGAQPPWVP